MKNTFRYLALFLGTTVIICCKKEAIDQPEKQYAEIEKANWFLGRWENNSAEGNLSENWKKVNDSTFFGECYFVINNDTVFAEHISLEERNGKLSYIASVPNQNNEQPVPFVMTEGTGQKLVFENPNHDYPTTIIYNQVGKDSLVAEIRGAKEGKTKNELFKMKKTE
jgi:hypothetical protein